MQLVLLAAAVALPNRDGFTPLDTPLRSPDPTMSLQAMLLAGWGNRGDPTAFDMANVRSLAQDLKLGVPVSKAALPASERVNKMHEKSLGAVELALQHATARINELCVSVRRAEAGYDCVDEKRDKTGAKRYDREQIALLLLLKPGY